MFEQYMVLIKIGLAIAVFTAGGFVVHHFDQKKIDELNIKLGSYEETINSMTALVMEQNTGIDKMKTEADQRAKDAQNAINDALAAAAEANTKAEKILLSKPPKGKNVCTAAEEAFRAELNAERNGK
jgi:uncharacterized coiled-coil protein SlyX